MPDTDPLGNNFHETTIAAVAQGAAGTTTLVTPGAAQKVYVTGMYLTLDAAGTLKFTETAGDLTGVMNLGGASASPLAAFAQHPILWTSTAGEALKITTVTGKAQGWISYFVA